MDKLRIKSLAKYATFLLRDKTIGPSSERNFAPYLAPGAPTYFLTAIIRVKNEARFLPELIAHHSLLGVEHFYIYDNNSEDKLQEVLDPLVARGLVTVIPWPIIPAAPSCYRHFFETNAFNCQWVAFIDADEFIVERDFGRLIASLTSAHRQPALAINWQFFGSSYHDEVPDGLVIENFTMRARSLNSHVKVVAQPSKILSYVNTHSFVYRGFAVARTASGFAALGTRSRIDVGAGLQINHYFMRSRRNYIDKAGQGFGDKEGFRQRSRREERTNFEFERNNEQVDLLWAERYGPEIRKSLISFGYASPYI